jgi:hypothetical protein
MFKYSLIFLLLFAFQSYTNAQKHGNEWIDYSQKYYTFKIATSGFYKLDYSSLRNSGVDVSKFSSANIQILAKEREVPIYVNDGGDNKLDSGDFILFYATKNDGWIDSLLFDSPEDIGNPGTSLINDTLTYFFSWNNNINNLRFQYDTTTAYSNITPANFWIYQGIISNTGYYFEANGKNGELSSLFKPGEGWTFNQDGVKSNVSSDYDLVNSTLLYTGSDAPLASFHFKNTSHSDASFNGVGNHHFRLSLKNSNEILVDTIFKGYKLINSNFTIPALKLKNNGIIKYSIINDQQALTDFQGLGYVNYKYPQLTNMSGLNFGEYFIQNNKVASKIRLSISNHSIKQPFVLVYGDVLKYIAPNTNNSNLEVVIPNSISSNEQRILVGDLTNVTTVNKVVPVNITGFFTNYSKISSEEAILMIYPTVLQPSAVKYASYRTSAEGGAHNVVFASVEELFLQYGGGVPKHFIAIRRFAKHMFDQSLHKPTALFLIGKAISNSAMKYNSSIYAQNLIPVFGSPASDVAYTAKLDGTMIPLLPTGRVSILTNAELDNYLEKVQEYEKQQDPISVYSSKSKDWQKHILHFAGGSNTNQQSAFQGYLAEMKKLAEDKYFGGTVLTIKKQTSAPIDPVALKEVTKRIEDGVSVMNFFGHSNAASFDVGIDDPENWNNKGKYPFIIGNGCNSGDVYSTQESFSHRLLSLKNTGGIAFLSPSSLGYDAYLSKYTTALYRQFSVLNYGGTIGGHIKGAIAEIYSKATNNLDESTCFSMSLNGDPMLKINSHLNPELEITSQSINFEPKNIDYSTDSIQMQLVVKNLGKSMLDTVQVEVNRKFPKYNTDSTYTKFIYGVNYLDTIYFKFPVQSNISIGQNQFDVRIDIPSFVKEQYDELENNQITSTLNIAIDGITPVYPYEYAIIGYDTVTLKASTTNPFSEKLAYVFEIDTSYLFNSPIKRTATLTQAGGIQEVKYSDWKSASSLQSAPLICEDSVVYFWRVSIDSLQKKWKYSSFQYIKNKYGWGQSSFGQFLKNDINKIEFNETNRSRIFDSIALKLEVRLYDNPTSQYMYSVSDYRINNEMQDYATCSSTIPSLHVVVIDPITLKPWKTHYQSLNTSNYFGNRNENGACGRKRPDGYFIFDQTDAQSLTNFQNMVNNVVPDGHYLIVYTMKRTDYASWDTYSPAMYQTFKNLGSDSIFPNKPQRSFIFFCRKGDKSSVIEKVAQYNGEYLNLKTELKSLDNKGLEVTPLIGPITKSDKIYWSQKGLEIGSDTTKLKFEGYDKNLKLIKTVTQDFNSKDSILIHSLYNDSLTYLKLSADYIDNLTKTPAQIKYWRVIYNPVPEAAVDPKSFNVWLPTEDTIREGMKLKFGVSIKNISDWSMDSLKVNYWLLDKENQLHTIDYPRQDSLRKGDFLNDTIVVNTKGFSGENTLVMEVNPYINSVLTDQPEQYHFNNIVEKNFYVKKDIENPILDVTFNGKHIMNGDLIPSKSEVLISLKDENEFDIMDSDNDTSFFWVYLTNPAGVQTRIPFTDSKGNKIMQWTPATNQNKKFKINYPAYFEKDGIYTLQVQGADRNGNLSGKYEYKIQFEVQNEQQVSYLINYPNPFSTETRFVYTLTGSTPPTDVKIQILSITGKVVKEITNSELGTLSIGRNQMTNYAWDGRDEFGDQLANGVYLYRVIVKNDQGEVKHLSNQSDNYFKNEFGKMYLMR